MAASATAHEGTRPSGPSLYPILSVNFVGTLGFSIVLPFLVFLVTRLGGNALIYGLMGATYSFFQLVGAPILGRWSDRYGRKRILLLSQLGTLASWGIFLVALGIPVTPMLDIDSRFLGAFTLTLPLVVLFFARALDGITGGNVSVANAYLADITDESDRSANFGKMAVSANLGFIVGPALAGVLGATALGETLPVMAAFVISVVATLIIAFMLEETTCATLARSPEAVSVRKVLGQEQKDCYRLETAPHLSTMQILGLPTVSLLLTLHFLVFLAFNLFYIAFPVHAATSLNWTLTETGVFFSVMGFMMVIVQGPLLKRASRVLSDKHLVVGGSLLLGVSFLFFTGRETVTIYGGTALLCLGNGVMWPSLLATLSKATDQRVQGAVQGIASSSGAVASVIGLLIGGVLYGLFGGSVFVLSGVITGIVFVAAFGIRRQTR